MVRWYREVRLTSERSSILPGNGNVIRKKIIDGPVTSKLRTAKKVGHYTGEA